MLININPKSPEAPDSTNHGGNSNRKFVRTTAKDFQTLHLPFRTRKKEYPFFMPEQLFQAPV
jgi:hypothetical protein